MAELDRRVVAPAEDFEFASTLPPARSGFILMAPGASLLLILLVFFYLGSLVDNAAGISINLPQTEEQVVSVADKVVVSVTREGVIYFNDQPLQGPQDLEASLNRLIQQRRREPIIILRADQDLSVQKLVQVMSIARRCGSRVFLATGKTQNP